MRLVLLIDLIKDWARDDFRATIIAEFEVLAGSLHTAQNLQSGPKRRDSDIFSMNSSQISEAQLSQIIRSSQGSMNGAMPSMDNENVPPEDPTPLDVHADLETAKGQRIGETVMYGPMDNYVTRQNRKHGSKIDNAMPGHRRERALRKRSSQTRRAGSRVSKPVPNILQHHPVSKSKAKRSDKDSLIENEVQEEVE